jgi:hypothetical protein
VHFIRGSVHREAEPDCVGRGLETRIATQRQFIRRSDESGPRWRSRDTSILRMPRSARERDRVAHVGKPGIADAVLSARKPSIP